MNRRIAAGGEMVATGLTSSILRRAAGAIVLAVVVWAGATAAAQAATISVTSTNDDSAVDGTVSLREAIQSIDGGANLNADVVAVGSYGTSDAINFSLAGSGTHTISLTSALPALTAPMTIDASSQPGKVVLDGTSAGSADGLKAQAKATITGLVIDNFSGHGINLDVGSGQSVIQNDLIGVDASGTTAAANGAGVLVTSSSDTIGGTGANQGNVISGNSGDGIVVNGSSATVIGNFIGLNEAGGAAVGNGGNGVTIGGQSAALGVDNVISGNVGDGVHITSSVTGGASVRGNRIGTNFNGTSAIPNSGNGVSVSGKQVAIGGGITADRNLISGNGGNGVLVSGALDQVDGNFIGTDVNGVNAIGNHGDGVRIAGASTPVEVIAQSQSVPQEIWFNGGFGINDLDNGDNLDSNSIFANAGGGISVGPLVERGGPVDLSADRQIVTVPFVGASWAAFILARAYDNPGAAGCPGQGKVALQEVSAPTDPIGSGTAVIHLGQPLPVGDGLTVLLTDPGRGTTQFLCHQFPPSGGGGAAGPTRATISSLRETNSVFVVGRSSTPLTGQTSAKRHKKGTVFSFRLDQPATVRIAIQARKDGRRAGGKCRGPTSKLKHKHRCTRNVTIFTLTRAAHAGLNTVPFTGRIRGKALTPGRYQAVFTAIDAAGKSKPTTLRFRIVTR